MNRAANNWVQTTPDDAFCLFLRHCPGAPDPDRMRLFSRFRYLANLRL
jgi:hypothetical protein